MRLSILDSFFPSDNCTILCVMLLSKQTRAQDGPWEMYMATAGRAYEEARYPDAEKSLQAALKVAEGFGPEDTRLATNLNNLATLYQAQGHYAEAEPLYQRALAIMEKADGPEHPYVATSLENYASLLRRLGSALCRSDIAAFWNG